MSKEINQLFENEANELNRVLRSALNSYEDSLNWLADNSENSTTIHEYMYDIRRVNRLLKHFQNNPILNTVHFNE